MNNSARQPHRHAGHASLPRPQSWLRHDLRARGVKGLGVSILRLTRRFFELYPQIRQSLIAESATLEKGQPVVGESGQRLPSLLPASKVLEFSWTHLIELVRLDDPWKRAFYENECLKENWSVRQLQRQIGSLLYDRTALSTDKLFPGVPPYLSHPLW